MFLFFSARWVLWVHSDFLGISASKDSSSTRDSSTGSMSSPIGATFRFRVLVGLTSALLCHLRFPSADNSSQTNARHRSHCWFLQTSLQVEVENVVFEINKNEFLLSVPVHQLLEVIPHFLTNCAADRNHVSTIVSEVEILSSFARDFCRTAQNFVSFSESSVQRSEQSIFVVSMEFPSSSVRNPFTTGRPIGSSISCSCVQVHLHPFKPLRTAGGTGIQTSK